VVRVRKPLTNRYVAPDQRLRPKVHWLVAPHGASLALFAVAGTSLAPAFPQSRMMRLNTEQRQALELLANYRHGAAEELFVFVHRFNRDAIAALVLEGFITRKRGRLKASGKTTEIVRIRITDAGREALAAES
jgi:hypothetical protein